MTSNFLYLPAKTDFLVIGLSVQFTKIPNPTLTIPSSTTKQLVSSAQKLDVIFDSNLSFSDHISFMSKSCFSHICDLQRIRSTLDHKTRIHYCNFSHSL